jgi:hypothetical protein
LTLAQERSFSPLPLFPNWGDVLVSQEGKANRPSAEDILASIKHAVAQDKLAGRAEPSDLADTANIGAGVPRESEDEPAVPLGAAPSRTDLQYDPKPLVTSDARVSISASLAALEGVTQSDILQDSPAKEKAMELIATGRHLRALSEIEKDLLAAEAGFTNAETRRQQAEADAEAALDAINEYQAEIDAAVERLRRASPTGSKWSYDTDRSSNVLTLNNELSAMKETLGARHKFKYLATD